MTTNNALTAINLLDKVFEFTEMTPDANEWNLRSLKNNPSRQIRFRQIEALFGAFFKPDASRKILSKTKSFFVGDEKMSIQSFLRGDFIRMRTAEEYADLTLLIKEFVNKKDGVISQKRDIRIDELAFIFPTLINYKKQLRSLLTINSGWLEASSVTARFSIYLTDSVSAHLVGRYSELDDVIEKFINPKGLTFSEEELIANYNYPSENLRNVDMDFM